MGKTVESAQQRVPVDCNSLAVFTPKHRLNLVKALPQVSISAVPTAWAVTGFPSPALLTFPHCLTSHYTYVVKHALFSHSSSSKWTVQTFVEHGGVGVASVA